MKTALINGSPKIKKSASGVLLEKLLMYMENEDCLQYAWNNVNAGEKELAEILKTDTLVLAFPLYIDGIPSHLITCLQDMQDFIKKTKAQKEDQKLKLPKVFVIINNGFYEAHQSRFAMEMMQHWCQRSALTFAGGLCVGAGGIILSKYNAVGENGPFMPVYQCLKDIAHKIIKGQFTGRVEEVVPTLSRGMYKSVIHRGWNIMARKNGLKKKDMARQ